MKNIYLADDDAEDAMLLKEAAEEVCPDMQFTHSFDGKSLIDSLDTNFPPAPDLIFLDINMPVMNGHDAIRKIKAVKTYRDIPVIVYSTSSTPADIKEMYDAGADLYIVKPANFNTLKQYLNKVCNMDFKTNYSKPSPQDFLMKAS